MHNLAQQEVREELLQAQVEVAAPVCTSLVEVGGHLLRLRQAVAAAAHANGCRIAVSATAFSQRSRTTRRGPMRW
ncbi:glutamate-cysteine ligase family protein [Streptomyces sp. NPDC055103]